MESFTVYLSKSSDAFRVVAGEHQPHASAKVDLVHVYQGRTPRAAAEAAYAMEPRSDVKAQIARFLADDRPKGARIKSDRTSERYQQVRADAREAGFSNEHNDCAVVTVAAACNVPYAVAHAALEAAGRKDGGGARNSMTQAAITALGYVVTQIMATDIIQHYPSPHNNLRHVTSHHPERFPKHWPSGTFIMSNGSHIWAVVDGKNCDWSKGHALRASGYSIYRITKKDPS